MLYVNDNETMIYITQSTFVLIVFKATFYPILSKTFGSMDIPHVSLSARKGAGYDFKSVYSCPTECP